MGKCIIQSWADLLSVPDNKRHDLKEFNLQHYKYMKGDIRTGIKQNATPGGSKEF